MVSAKAIQSKIQHAMHGHKSHENLRDFYTTKYFAAGWCAMMAEVLCSGSSR